MPTAKILEKVLMWLKLGLAMASYSNLLRFSKLFARSLTILPSTRLAWCFLPVPLASSLGLHPLSPLLVIVPNV